MRNRTRAEHTIRIHPIMDNHSGILKSTPKNSPTENLPSMASSLPESDLKRLL